MARQLTTDRNGADYPECKLPFTGFALRLGCAGRMVFNARQPRVNQTMTKLPITVSMISGAEALRIGSALESVAGWTSEITVVLNSDVTDGTADIARQHGANVFCEPWRGFVAQKASAAQKATQDWVLGLDADEIVSPALRQEIERLFADKQQLELFAAYSFPRLTRFCGRWIRHGDWYPDRTIRLWRRESAQWGGIDPHARLNVLGRVGRLHGDLLHYSTAGIGDQVAKINPYSDDFANEARRRQRRATWFDLAVRPGWRFVRGYFLRLGFLDGWQGYYLAWMTAVHTLTRYAKVREANSGAPASAAGQPAPGSGRHGAARRQPVA
jgi:glycosyltransferase involved in cell wall biosynthesis